MGGFIMKLNIKQMNYEEAKQISKWIYKEPYSIYSMDESENCINELLNGYYYSVSDIENNLVGYYCFGEAAQVPAGNQFGVYDCKDITDIGLGINPNLCGQGLGEKFFNSGLDFARDKLSAKKFRLTVANFNQRAIKVYQRVGFKKVKSFETMSEFGKIEFFIMILN
jgi:RimJ/RimL family protein N-acetyltransferase